MTPDTPCPLPEGFHWEPMSPADAGQLNQWAIDEGWNPGLSDLRLMYALQAEAFIGLKQQGQLVAGGAIMSYGGRFGFMGLFIVSKPCRGRGLGRALWHHRRDMLRSRLHPGASIGMDGVLDMVPFYARGGFEMSGRDVRFQGIAAGRPRAECVPLREVPWPALVAFDRLHVPAPRDDFLRAWLSAPGSTGLAVMTDGTLRGYAFARPAQQGYKIGPLFAADPMSAQALLDQISWLLSGEQVQLDVPEGHAGAVEMARRQGWEPVFSCARMYLGARPDLPLDQIYGVTSFEFG